MEAEMLTALAIMAGAFGYVQIGRLWGASRYNLYRRMNRNQEKTLAHMVNFPAIYFSNSFQSDLAFADNDKKEKYQALFAFVWPLTAIWIPIAISLAGLNTLISAGTKLFVFPERALGAGYGALKSLMQKQTKPAELPAPQSEKSDEHPSIDELRAELNAALFDQEESSTRVNTLQEKIFLEESCLQGSYREAALPEPDKK